MAVTKPHLKWEIFTNAKSWYTKTMLKRIFLALFLLIGLTMSAQAQVVVAGYQGEWERSTVHDCKFTTNVAALGVSVPTTLAGTPAVKIYKDSATGTETTTGVTLTANFDSITGLNDLSIDTSNAFYAVGSDFAAVITQGTLGGTSVAGTVVCSFSVMFRPADLQYIDGLATSGNNATLNLKQLTVVPDVNTDAITITPSGTGLGIKGSGLAIARAIAYSNFQFKLVRASDNKTPVTGATVTATIMKDGGTFAAIVGTVVEDTLGWYHVPLSAGEMTADEIVLRFVSATSNTAEFKLHTNP